MLVRRIDNNIFYKIPFLLRFIKNYNHLITGIIDDGKKYAFDPTCISGVPVVFDEEFLSKNKIKQNGFAYSGFLDFMGEFCYTNGCLVNNEFDSNLPFNLFSGDIWNVFMLLQSKDMSFLQRDDIYQYINEKIDGSSKCLEDFYKEHSSRVKRIAELNSRIAPFSDKPISKIKIK